MEEKRRKYNGNYREKPRQTKHFHRIQYMACQTRQPYFCKKRTPSFIQYDTMKTFYSLQEKTPSPFIVKIYNVFATETLCIIEEDGFRNYHCRISGQKSPIFFR